MIFDTKVLNLYEGCNESHKNDVFKTITENIIKTELWNFNNISCEYMDERIKHRFWGRPYGCLCNANSSTKDKYYYFKDPSWLNSIKKYIQDVIFDNNYRMELEYCGLNGQTLGQEGSIHVDYVGEKSESLTIVAFIQDPLTWKEEFGGSLCLYEDDQVTLKEKIPYKPGTLVMFDSTIPHKAEAPVNTNELRISLVMRGKISEI